MGRILQLSSRLPYPPDDGGRIATWNLSRCLRHNGYTIDLVCFAPDSQARNVYERPLSKVFSSIAAIPRNVERQYPADLARALATGTSYFARKFSCRRFASAVKQQLLRNRYDITLVDNAFMGVYVPRIRWHREAAGRVALRQHNVEHEILERLAQRSSRTLTRLLLQREARLFRQFEWTLLDQADEIKAITQRDAERLAGSGTRTPISVLGPFVDVDEYQPDPHVTVQPHSIVSVGAMSWLPNVNGIAWFHEHVWPHVVAAFPDAKLYVVGKNPPPSIRRMAGPNVTVTGYVQDEKQFIRQAHLFIVPLFEGSGVRVKILTAMATGRDVLTTPIGAEGIEFPGLVVRQTAAEWVEAIGRHFGAGPTTSTAGVDYARRHYHWRRELRL